MVLGYTVNAELPVGAKVFFPGEAGSGFLVLPPAACCYG